jgi:hypothetical protein
MRDGTFIKEYFDFRLNSGTEIMRSVMWRYILPDAREWTQEAPECRQVASLGGYIRAHECHPGSKADGWQQDLFHG